MAGKLSAAQLAVINRKAKPKEVDPADEAGETNIVPFLDIITNILMFILRRSPRYSPRRSRYRPRARAAVRVRRRTRPISISP